jgi:hypothetical protein
MRRSAIGALLGFILLACDTGDRAADRRSVSSAGPEVSAAAIEAHLRFLADDLLEGRGTGTRGHGIAARYAAAHFGGLGLEPAGTDGYLQPVPFRRARLIGSTVVLDRAAGRRELVFERDYVAFPDFVRPRVEVTAPLVLVGFGVTAPARSYDDYRGVKAQGKIVVVLTGAPASFPPTERAHYSDWRTKFETAVR